MTGQPESQDQGLQFVYVTQGSTSARQKNSKLARAHAAKLNREKYRKSSRLQDVEAQGATGQPLELSQNLPLRVRESSWDRYGNFAIANPSDEGIFPGKPIWVHECADPTDCEKCAIMEALEKTYSQPRFFGKKAQLSITAALDSMPAEVQQWSKGTMSKRSLHHLLTVSWPTISGKAAAPVWFEEFCKSRLMIHVSLAGAAFHRDVLEHCGLLPGQQSQAPWSTDKQTLQHKGAALAMVQHLIQNLQGMTSTEIEQLIFAVSTLARHEVSLGQKATLTESLFSPYFPAVGWAAIFGRIKTQKAHMAAVRALVKYQGGLANISMKGLSTILARIDLFDAGADYQQPLFPCFWEGELVDLCETFGYRLDSSLGKGFTYLTADLPSQSIEIFHDLAMMNGIISDARLQKLSEDGLQPIMNVRNSIGYRLLSLPRWDDFDDETHRTMDRRAYEIAHLTCVIYQNAVLFSLSPLRSSQDLTTRLRWTLALDNPWFDAKEGLKDLVLWALCIGAIASHQGPNSTMFRTRLREFLFRRYKKPWKHYSEVNAVLHDFVWSNKACNFESIWREASQPSP